MVADAIKEEWMFMRKLQVYHEVPVSDLDKSGLKGIVTRWGYTNKCVCCGSVHPSPDWLRKKPRVSELTPEDASSTFAATSTLESLKFMLSRCMIGHRRALAEVKVLGFYDISRAHFHGPARRTIVIKVPREDDECKIVYAVLDEAMYGTKDAAQCFDVASENAMTAMGYDTGTLSPCPVRFERS